MMYSMKYRKNIQKDSVTVKFAPKSSTNCAGGVIEARITNDDLKCVKITADYNDNGTLKDSLIEKISIVFIEKCAEAQVLCHLTTSDFHFTALLYRPK